MFANLNLIGLPASELPDQPWQPKAGKYFKWGCFAVRAWYSPVSWHRSAAWDDSSLEGQKAGMSSLPGFHCCLVWRLNSSNSSPCWAREPSGLTEACFGFFGLSLKLMAGDNLVPVTLHLQLGYSQTILCQSLRALHTNTGELMFMNYIELCSETMCTCAIAFVTNFLRIS